MSTRVRPQDVAQRVADLARAPGRRVRSLGFPFTSAATPRGVEPAPTVERLGDHVLQRMKAMTP